MRDLGGSGDVAAGQDDDPAVAPTSGVTTRRVGVRVLGGTAAALVLAVVVTAAAAGAQAALFTVGAAVAVLAGVVVLAWRSLGLQVDPDAPVATTTALVGRVMVVRGASWLLYAGTAATGGSGAPVPGDLVAPAVGAFTLAATLHAARLADGRRFVVLVLDAAAATSSLLVALWVLVLGPAVGFSLDRGAERWVTGLSAIAVTMLVLAVLVISPGAMGRAAPTMVGLALVTVADVGVLLGGLDGVRTVPPAALACWVAGWPLLAYGALRTRRPSPAPEPGDLTRHAILSTELSTVLSGAALLVTVVVWTSDGGPDRPPHALGLALVVLAVVAFVVRELIVGRERVRTLDDLLHQAGRDPLTGLANRRELSERIRLLPPGGEWVILAVDLDGFKAVNDVHGHATGDALLVRVADVLRDGCPADGVAARTGGDEFAVLVPGDVERGRRHAGDIVAAVPAALAPLRLGPRVTVSVGVGRLLPRATAEAAGEDRLGALVEATAALHAAKSAGRNRVQVYPGFVARGRERRLQVEASLRRAVEDGDLFTVGQPLVDLVTWRVVAVEALARWHDPVLGDVPPAEFVAVAEESGLVADVGRLVLRSALQGFADNDLIASGLRLSVNVSPIELRSPGFVEQVADALQEFRFRPAHLTVEVTEAVLIAEDDPAVRVLAALGDLGANLAIDDFGTGYSALGYLRRLPVHTLKIDRSLVVDARSSVRTRHIVAGVVDMASRLGLVVVLEGVEDEQAVRLGRQCGAHLGQGYLSGRPMDWQDVAAAWAADPSRGAAGPGGGSRPASPGRSSRDTRGTR